MRWLLGVMVVVAAVVHAEEAPVHRQPPIALRMSVLAGGGFILPAPTCSGCGAVTYSTASLSAAAELAVVLRSRAGEGYFANQLLWYPIFDMTPRYALTSGLIQQMLALTAEVGFLGRVHERVLFGGGALVALSFSDQRSFGPRTLRLFGNVVMPGLTARVSLFLDQLQIHRVGLNVCVLARLAAQGVILLPTLSYSAALPW